MRGEWWLPGGGSVGATSAHLAVVAARGVGLFFTQGKKWSLQRKNGHCSALWGMQRASGVERKLLQSPVRWYKRFEIGLPWRLLRSAETGTVQEQNEIFGETINKGADSR